MEFEFDLDNPVENLDNVPSTFHHMFEQGDSGFALTEQGRGVAEMLNGLTKNLKSSRATKKSVSDESAQRRQQLSVFETAFGDAGFEGEEFTADTVGQFLSGLTAKAGGAEDVQERLNAQKAEMTRAHTAALEAKDGEISEMRGSLDKYLLNSEATAAIAAEKGVPDLLMPFIMQQAKVQKADNGDYVARVLDASGDVRYNGKGDPMTVTELVQSMKADAKYGRLFDAETPTGGGASPSPKPLGKTNANPGGEDKSAVSKIAAGLGKMNRGRR